MTCCETMRPRPERPVIASCTRRDRNADGERRASFLAGRHRRRDDVAAERAGEVEGVLRGARHGVGVGDLDGQRRADALGAIARWPVSAAPCKWHRRLARCRRGHWRDRRQLARDRVLAKRLGRRSVRAREPEHAGAREGERGGGGHGDEHPAANREPPASPTVRLSGCSAAISRTRARSSAGAEGRDARSSWIRSGDDVMVSHPLFELRKCTAQSGRDGRGGDPEQAGGLLAFEIENDAQRDNLALSGRESPQALGELGREALAERRRSTRSSPTPARSSRLRRRASARNQSSAVERAIASSQARGVPRPGSKRRHLRYAASNVSLVRSSATAQFFVR